MTNVTQLLEKSWFHMMMTEGTKITSLPGSRDYPRPETLSLFSSSHLRPHSFEYINHLFLFSSSLSTRISMRDDLMCSVDRAVDRSVAAVHLRPNFLPLAEATEGDDEVEIRCARFAAASRSSWTRFQTVSGCRRLLRRGCKRQTSRFERQLPTPLAGATC
jgi:hypothetical protein